MKIPSLSRIIPQSLALAATLAAGGCGLIHEELEPCAPGLSVRVPVSYTMNMAFADALPNQVERLTLYAADEQGRIVATQTRTITQLAADGYAFSPALEPGTYDMLIWGAGRSAADAPASFGITTGASASYIPNISATLPLEGTAPDLYSTRDIVPLFHGLMRNVEIPDVEDAVTTPTIDLTKDTNLIEVLIQTADGSALDPENFTFSIEASDSKLDYTNQVISTTPFRYLPWAVTPVSASRASEVESGDTPKEDSQEETESVINGMLAEMTTGRLMADRDPMLVITRQSDATDVIRINLINCLLLVKGEYHRQMTDQEYLDRNDTYSLIFFLTSAGEWNAHLGIFINGWRVVPPQQQPA